VTKVTRPNPILVSRKPLVTGSNALLDVT